MLMLHPICKIAKCGDVSQTLPGRYSHIDALVFSSCSLVQMMAFTQQILHVYLLHNTQEQLLQVYMMCAFAHTQHNST